MKLKVGAKVGAKVGVKGGVKVGTKVTRKAPGMCRHMLSLAREWARVAPAVTVIEGSFEMDCSTCGVKCDVAVLLEGMDRIEREEMKSIVKTVDRKTR